jgi:hypothetical protein
VAYPPTPVGETVCRTVVVRNVSAGPLWYTFEPPAGGYLQARPRRGWYVVADTRAG